MQFNELIETNNWLSISITLTSLYPNQKESLTAYEKVYDILLQMEPSDSAIEIVLQQCYDDETNEESYVAVSGLKKDNPTEGLAIEFVPWTEWLGMTVSSNALNQFNELEIISHCLYEMTFMGFDENEIQKQLSEIKKTAEEYENMTPEEGKNNSTSLEDFLKELDNE
ncbi:DUF6557 family protein [uncultured Mucilaginibacter sp.]|uniref:DUF6557 family protein n=1 Tax=uncultured Mucilaginibacter sp. TaxID=797541 RepID=UPI002624D363|nr:DUF6557 family protein [uncultured Mucilaginibacter sp.]